MELLPTAALHDLDPEFRSFSRSEKVAAVLESLRIQRPLPVQSMYIFKVGYHTALVCISGPKLPGLASPVTQLRMPGCSLPATGNLM